MKQTLIPTNDGDNTNLSLEVSTDQIKHFFHFLHGQPTTRTASFTGAIYVKKDDVVDLIKNIKEQLNLAHVQDAIINVAIGFEKEVIEKSFEEFYESRWRDSEKTKEVTIKVNFIFNDVNSGNPFKHSFMVRISKGMKPGNLLQLLASGNTEALDDLQNTAPSIFCRTEHTNDKLSKDLIGVVRDWHKSQKQPKILSPTFGFFRKHKRIVARTVHYSYSIAIAFIFSYLAFILPSLVISENLIAFYLVLLISFITVNNIALNIGGSRAQKTFSKLSDLSEDDVIFDITKGDDKEYSEALDNNKEIFKEAKSIFLWTNGKAILTSLIAALIFEFLKNTPT